MRAVAATVCGRALPLWQNGVVPLGNSTTALRGTPDIAMDADNELSAGSGRGQRRR